MSKALKNKQSVRVVGKSWVLRLPDEFTAENDLAKGTQVLLTFKNGDNVEAEILPPLSKDLSRISKSVLKKRKNVFEELKRAGD